MPLNPPFCIAHYRVTARIGAGGMGEVYRGTDTRLGREVAIKMLAADVSGDRDRLARLQGEARAVAALNHPNIVTLHSVEEWQGIHFLTMELVDGQSLERLITGEGVPLDRLLDIADGITQALIAAHDKALVHRDLKPANVMIAGDGRVKVLDFGLAKYAEQASAADHTATFLPPTEEGVAVGTLPYMSPEQLLGRGVDRRTDLFSLGVILYEMATGRRPFRGATSAEVAASILRDDPLPLIQSQAGVPRELLDLIRQCLAKDAAQRMQTARLVRDKLTQARSGSHARVTSADGFWVAVLPFRSRSADASVAALAEGITEEISAGLSRFSYLQVIAPGSAHAAARYVLEGTLRQAGSRLRVTAQVSDTTTGIQLWAETYERAFSLEAIFEIQDDLVSRIVSTCADSYGVLTRTISAVVRGTDPRGWSPSDALVHFFGYHQRLTPTDHLESRRGLERAVEIAPRNADCWASLSVVYAHEYGHGFNPLPESLGRALLAARRALDLAPGNALAHEALSTALLFRKELVGCVHEADRAIELNPLDGGTNASMGANIAFAGDWDRGCALIERSMDLNPQHPVWYRGMLSLNEYRKANYRDAVSEAIKANAPDLFWLQVIQAAAHGQLGEPEAAAVPVRTLLAQMPAFPASAAAVLGTWLQPELVDHLIQGLRKAGIPIA